MSNYVVYRSPLSRRRRSRRRRRVFLLALLLSISLALSLALRVSGFPSVPAPRPARPQAPAASSPSLLPVPYASQEGLLPTGCELVSAYMVLQYCGASLSLDEFLSAVPRQDFWYENGRLTNLTPGEAFIGSPYSPGGYGCYAPVIQTALEKTLPAGWQAEDVTGCTLEDAVAQVQSGSPVLLWATINMANTEPGTTWRTPAGEDFTWLRHEHCLVLVGADEDTLWFNDPYASNGLVSWPRETVRSRFEQLGSQAVVVSMAD